MNETVAPADVNQTVADQTVADHDAATARLGVHRWSLNRRLAIAFSVAGIVLAASAVVSLVSLDRVNSATDAQVNRYDPALLASQNLLTALINQETGVRGYALSGNLQFLDPFTQGLADQKSATATLTRYLNGDSTLQHDLMAVSAAAQVWQSQTAEIRIDQVRDGDQTASQTLTDVGDKARFDAVRSASAVLTDGIGAARGRAHQRLRDAITFLIIVLSIVAALVVLASVLAWLALRRWVRRPLDQLGRDSRIVADGDFDHVVIPVGPAELHQVGQDVEAMRRRITHELAAVSTARAELATQADELIAQAAALEQSNADLEQFAYVASHDLQEPLRKVSNFCQLIERQYGPQLDDRARQYITYAVDGAHRMQILIQDLLAFSRVGRSAQRFTLVDLAEVTRHAAASLDAAIAEANATIDVREPLPSVFGDDTLLTALMQNLIGNAIKYRGDEAVVATISATGPVDGYYTVSVTDNGIGIDGTYAERIFVIFQRLHLRDQYGGTGIGLALGKKIVEYHGGRIWLDTEYTGGARFCFTLPDRSSL
jgi:signal transduction histidine kinase